MLDGEPELVLGEDRDPNDAFGKNSKLTVPYVYERDHGMLLGMDGMHGTSPTDYRFETTEPRQRIVVSVYLGDFSSNDDNVRRYVDEWGDPPYPNYHRGQLHWSLTQRVHWKRDDPSVSIGNPMPRKKFGR